MSNNEEQVGEKWLRAQENEPASGHRSDRAGDRGKDDQHPDPGPTVPETQEEGGKGKGMVSEHT